VNATAPAVRLGRVAQNGIAPALFALVERGVDRNPGAASALRGRAELRFAEGYPPVVVASEGTGLLVEDVEPGERVADLVVTGSLPDVLSLASAPQAGGLPKLTSRQGRAALATVARRRVRIVGSKQLARRLLRLLAI
jgi:hypothetical protein